MNDPLPVHVKELGLTFLKIELRENMGRSIQKERPIKKLHEGARATLFVQKDNSGEALEFSALGQCLLAASSKALHNVLCSFLSVPGDVNHDRPIVEECPGQRRAVVVHFSDGQKVWRSRAFWESHMSFLECYLRSLMNGYIYWLQTNKKIPINITRDQVIL